MRGLNLSPWMTRREAAEYLHWKVEEVSAQLIPLEANPSQVPGKLRYQVMAAPKGLRVQVLAADVFATLPVAFTAARQAEQPQALFR